MGYTIDFIDGIYTPNNIVPLVHINSIQGNVHIVSSLAAAGNDIASSHRTAGMIIKTSDDNKYYMYTSNDDSQFNVASNWVELNTSTGGGGGGDGSDGASAFELWQGIAGNESGTLGQFFADIGGGIASQWYSHYNTPSYHFSAAGNGTGTVLNANDMFFRYNGDVYQYNGSSWVELASIAGPDGVPGLPGIPGLDGQTGTSVQAVSLDAGGFLSMSLSDGTPFVFGPITGSDGADGASGAGISLQGSDTVYNILNLPAPVPGYLYVTTTAGVDSNGTDVAIGDGLAFSSDGTWVTVGQIQGPPGAPGDNGLPGIDGTQWLSGAGTPSNGGGSTNDFYYDTTNDKIYKKGGSTWSELTDLTVPGWTSGSYNSSTGQITFTHADSDYTFTTDPVTGSQGPAGSISSVTAHTVPYGNSTSVTQSGTQDVTLDFAIPGGAPGQDGAEGASAFQIYKDEGNTGDEATFLTSLAGSDGAAGDAGAGIASVGVNGNDIEFTLNDTDGTILTLSNAMLQLKGDVGEPGTTLQSVAFSGNNMVFTLTNSAGTVILTDAKIDLKGDTGEAGAGVDIIATTSSLGIAGVNTTELASGSMYILESTGDQGNGISGSAGEGITWASEVWTNVGAIRGPSGSQGPTGGDGASGSIGPAGNDGDNGASVSQSYFQNEDVVFKLSNNTYVTWSNALTTLTGSATHATAPFTSSTISASSWISSSAVEVIGDLHANTLEASKITASDDMRVVDKLTVGGVIEVDDSILGDQNASAIKDFDYIRANKYEGNFIGGKSQLHFSSGALHNAVMTQISGSAIGITEFNPHGVQLTSGNLIFVEPDNAYISASNYDIRLNARNIDLLHLGYLQDARFHYAVSASGFKTHGDISSSGDVTASNMSLDGIPNVSASLAAALAGGDDLGNHTAVMKLNLNNNEIYRVTSIAASGEISTSGVITASAYYGDGSQLTGITPVQNYVVASGTGSLTSITASGDISASGNIIASEITGSIHTSSILNFDTEVSRSISASGFGSGGGEGVFATTGSEKDTTSHLNISGSLDIHTSSNAIVTYDATTGVFDSKTILSLAGNSIYDGESLTDTDGINLQWNTELSKDWFTFKGGIPRLGINVANPKSMIHLSASAGNIPQIKFESGSKSMLIGMDVGGGTIISASDLVVTGSLTIEGEFNFPTNTSITLTGDSDATLQANTANFTINHAGNTSVGKTLTISSSIIVLGDESQFTNRVIIPELVIPQRSTNFSAYNDTLYSDGSSLIWKGKKLLTSAYDNLSPTTGFYSPDSMSIYTTNANSQINIATPNLNIRGPISSDSGFSIEFNSPIGLPIYTSVDQIRAIPTGSLRGGETVALQIPAGTPTVYWQSLWNMSNLDPVLHDNDGDGQSVGSFRLQGNSSAGQPGFNQNWEDITEGNIASLYYNRRGISQYTAALTAAGYDLAGDTIEWNSYPWQAQIQVNDIIKINNEQLRVIDFNPGSGKSRLMTVERGYNSTPTNTGNVGPWTTPWYRYVNAVTEAASQVTVYVWSIYELRWRALAYQAGSSEGTHYITGSV